MEQRTVCPAAARDFITVTQRREDMLSRPLEERCTTETQDEPLCLAGGALRSCHILKARNKSHATIYRPISLTCASCKIMVHLVSKSLYYLKKITTFFTGTNMVLDEYFQQPRNEVNVLAIF